MALTTLENFEGAHTIITPSSSMIAGIVSSIQTFESRALTVICPSPFVLI
jgi:hypothetical protein